MTAREYGKYIEDMVSRHLQKQGLKLIAQNYYCRRGEIDLIMQENQTLVFVEVRFRKNNRFGSALESVTPQKQLRILHTANHYLQQHPVNYETYRFDVVSVTGTDRDQQLQWIKNAFQCE